MFTRATFLIPILLILGCAQSAKMVYHGSTGFTYSGARASGSREPLDLTLGSLLVPTAFWGTSKQSHYVGLLRGRRLFQNVVALDSKSDPESSDVMVLLKPGNFSGAFVSVFSSYTQEKLFTVKIACGSSGITKYPDCASHYVTDIVYEAFSGDSALYKKIEIERRRKPRKPRPMPKRIATATPLTPPTPRDGTSDIDIPGYRTAERPDNFAVVIGIDDYQTLPNARFAERDAQTMRDHLIAMGYPKRHVVLLKGDNATRTGIQKYMEEWLPRNVKPTSTVFFYYSGHGAPEIESGKAYLVPWNGDASFLKSTAYPVEKLYASLNQLKAKQIIVALDACFSGAGGRSVLAKDARPLVTQVDQGYSKKGRIALFTAASGSEITTTIPDEGHGIFTYYFIKGLQGDAKNDAGEVTAKSLHKFLKPKVQDEARLQNREQTPTLHTSSDLVIR